MENRQKGAILSCWHWYYCCKTSCLLKSIWKEAAVSHVALTKLSKLYMVSCFLCSCFASFGKWQKSYFQAPLLHSWTQCTGSPQSPTQGDTAHWFSETHTQAYVKIKAPFLMNLPLGFLLFLLLLLHRCDSLSGIPSCVANRQQTDDYVQSFFPHSHDDFILFFGFCSPLFQIQHFSFNFCVATPVSF